MIARYQSLAERLRAELQALEITLAAIQRHWQRFQTSTDDQDAYLNSVALNLHSFYSALERMFQLVAVEIDGGTLGGEHWHSELLNQMSLSVSNVRPAVITPATARQLDEYRRFRHLVRNVYATNLDPGRIEALVKNLPGLWERIRDEVARFIQFLETLAESDEV